jgi:2-keto-4-pentenoate hydratase/2-oxohepta-3-ene-1,7-dioic acid hydratase in catechol pathway
MKRPVDQAVFDAVRTFYAAGLNFRAHIEWANSRDGAKYQVPRQADIGYRATSGFIASGEEIVIPADSPGPVEYEGELVAVIGRKARNLTEANALGRRPTAPCGAPRAPTPSIRWDRSSSTASTR